MTTTDSGPGRTNDGGRVTAARTESKKDEFKKFLSGFRKSQNLPANKAIDSKIAEEVL